MNHFLTNLVRRGAGLLPPSSPQPEFLPTFATQPKATGASEPLPPLSGSLPLDSLPSQEVYGEFFDPFDEIASQSFLEGTLPPPSTPGIQRTSSQALPTERQTNPSTSEAEAIARSAADNVSLQPRSQTPILNQPPSKPTKPTAVSPQITDQTNQSSSRLNSVRSLQEESVPSDISQSPLSEQTVQKAPSPPPLTSPSNLESPASPHTVQLFAEVTGRSVTPAKNDSQLQPSRQNPDLGSFEQPISPAAPPPQSPPLPSTPNPPVTPIAASVEQPETSLLPAHQTSQPLPGTPTFRDRAMPSEPPIQVRIGQVEVRMTQPAIAPLPAPSTPKPKDFSEFALARSYLDRIWY